MPQSSVRLARASGAAAIEMLERRVLMAFGLTTTTNLYTVDTGSGLVFSVQRTHPSGSVGDLTSAKLNGTELEAPFATSSRYSHYESGLSSATVVTATVDPSNQWILIACDDTGATGVGVIQYYIGRKGFNNIYMATYAPGPGSPSPGEMRFIDYTNPSVLTNIPAPSNNNGSTGAIESSDVFGHADGTTTSKYYGEYRAIDKQTYGMTGNGFGMFMNIGNRETSSGGPFYKDIDFQNNELYTYVFSGHSQTENFRPGLHGPYALQLTTGATPAAPDYSFVEGIGLAGYVPSAQRGTLSGVASGAPAGLQATVALSNAGDQYWALPDPNTGTYTISGVVAGTYTETLYQGELAVGTVPVTITAGATTRQNIVNANSYIEESSASATTTTPVVANPVWRIGTWDGTPIGFLNADKITNMHPTDVRMSPWAADSTGLTNFTVGVDPDSSFPMAEWHTQTAAAPFVDTDNRITFTLTAAQATTALSLRIGLSRLDSARPNISVNGHSTTIQSIASEPNSRGLTTGNWRGNNAVYIFSLSTSWMVAGTNTIDISSVSGSTGTLYAGYHIYDAIDLVNTSALTNASVVKTITVTPANPTVVTNAQQQFTATAKDQFGAVMPANFAWSDLNGTVDGTGLYTAPAATGSDTVTATSGTVSGSTNVTVAPPLQVNSASFQYLTQQAVVITFNKDVDTTKLTNAFTLVNLTTNTTVPATSIHLSYANKTATFTFTSQLADGNYRATIPASAALTAGGEHLASDMQLNFFTLRGDANADRTVDVGDLGALGSNYGMTSGATWAQGDFNYDGHVDVADLGALASTYGQTLAAATSASVAAPAATFAVASAPTSSAAPLDPPTPLAVTASIFATTPITNAAWNGDDQMDQRLKAVGLE